MDTQLGDPANRTVNLGQGDVAPRREWSEIDKIVYLSENFFDEAGDYSKYMDKLGIIKIEHHT